MLCSKSLLDEIKTISEEGCIHTKNCRFSCPHMRLVYKSKDQFKNAADLIIHHVKHHADIHEQDKQKIEELMQNFVTDLFTPGLFYVPSIELSSDENGDNFNEGIASRPFSEERGHLRPALSIMENHIPGDSYVLFFGNKNWYIFFRLHYALCQKLYYIQSMAVTVGRKVKINSIIYSTFLKMVRSLLDGTIENKEYERTLREMYGQDGNVGFTIDKIIQDIVHQLQHIAGNGTCLHLFRSGQRHGGAGGLCATVDKRGYWETIYQERSKCHLAKESIFKCIFYVNEAKLTIQCLKMK